MKGSRYLKMGAAVVACVAVVAVMVRLKAPAAAVDFSKMQRIGDVDERFGSYNIEMVEVTGGRFWKPYGNSKTERVKAEKEKIKKLLKGKSPASSTEIDPSMYQYRPPIDLSNPELRKLAAALGPAYVRVSGTWANSVFFQDADAPAAARAPNGFSGILTAKEWKGVVDFTHAVNAELVTSVATSTGARDARGVWTSDQARKLFDYTQSVGGKIAAVTFMNEPTFAALGGAPKGYDAAAFGRDIRAFQTFLRSAAPDTILLGPDSVGEGLGNPMGSAVLKTEDLLHSTDPVFDVFSYHMYAAASQRCASVAPSSQTTADAALSQDWLARPQKINDFYTRLRDGFAPGKPVWITETAEAACGGNPWAATFLDTFRFVIQHASLAQRGVKVIMHNTLAASDYGLLDEKTLAPRPNYWVAWLWRRFMGTTVLNPGSSPRSGAYFYAQCYREHPGGVALVIVNADTHFPLNITLSSEAERYTLTADKLEDTAVQLNGKRLQLNADGELPQISGEPIRADRVSLPPVSISFLISQNAQNSSCRQQVLRHDVE